MKNYFLDPSKAHLILNYSLSILNCFFILSFCGLRQEQRRIQPVPRWVRLYFSIYNKKRRGIIKFRAVFNF